MTGSPWPLTAVVEDGAVLGVGGVDLADLARDRGTPLWVVDEADVRARCRSYRAAFPGAVVAYASKAWPTVGLVQMMVEEGLWVDVASAGELHTAIVAGAPADKIIFHGNNKSVYELEAAAQMGVGRVVVDSFDELERLEAVGAAAGRPLTCWLRVTPGIDAHTHEYVRTGHDDTKFGFTLSSGLADEAMERAGALEHVDVVGAHAHVGSQIFGTDPLAANAEVMVGLLARWRDRFGVELSELNLGGGMAVRYTHEDHPVDVAHYGAALGEALAVACAAHHYPAPQLFVEPGRALVAPATLTLYTVGTIKRLPGIRTYVSVDGGMSDNIRPALYGAEHEVALAGRLGGPDRAPFTVVGKHCESGDLLRERVALPADLAVGDLLAVAATGAYGETMASNYNRLPRPAAVLVKDGDPRLLIRRETIDDLLSRDVPLG